MNNEPRSKYEKAISACRLVAVLSAILLLILMALLYRFLSGDMNWTDGITEYLVRAAAIILSVGVFLPPFIIIACRLKIQGQESTDRITALEQEVERLKKNR